MVRLGFAVSRVPKCEGPGAPIFIGAIHFLGTWATRPLESFRRSTYDWPPSALLPESIVRQWELILCKTSADHASKGLDKDRSFNKSPAMKSVQILKVY